MLCKFVKNNSLRKFIVFTGVIMLIFSSCSKKSEEPKVEQQSHEEEQKSEEIPKQLSELEDNIEKIIKSLDGPAVATKDDKDKKDSESSQGEDEDKKSSEGSQEENKDKKSSESSQGESEGEGSQGESKGNEGEQGGESKKSQDSQKDQDSQQKQSSQQKAQEKDPWKEITPVINNMHYKWNSYMPEAAKKGANKELIDGFSNALNSLTDTVIKKNKTDTLMAASNLYAYIPDFYSLYKTSISPEIKRLRHYSRNAILNSMTANWEQAGTDINNLKDSWSLFKNTIPKDNEEDSGKLDFSIYELDKVIKEKNQPLTDIKGRVTLSNIESLEKSLEEGKKGQNGQGGQSGGGSSDSESNE